MPVLRNNRNANQGQQDRNDDGNGLPRGFSLERTDHCSNRCQHCSKFFNKDSVWHRFPETTCKRNPQAPNHFKCKYRGCPEPAGHQEHECKTKKAGNPTGDARTEPYSRTCKICGESGHPPHKCPLRTNNNNNNNNNNGCRECGEFGHFQRDCPNRMNEASFKGKKNGPASNNEKWQPFLQPRQPICTSPRGSEGVLNTPYCSVCNNTSHKTEQCLNAEAWLRHQKSFLRCTMCAHMGHTQDECRNPLYQPCPRCRRPGHLGRECTAESDDVIGHWSDMHHAFRGTPSSSVNVFKVSSDKEKGKGKLRIKPSHRRAPNHLDTSSPTTDQLDEAKMRVMDKILESHAKYPRKVVNDDMKRNAHRVKDLLTARRLEDVDRIIRSGGTIWRDPMTIALLFARRVPKCGTCGCDGQIANRNFDHVKTMTPATDLIKLEDHEGWGLFIVFPCSGGCAAQRMFTSRHVNSTETMGYDENDLKYRPYYLET